MIGTVEAWLTDLFETLRAHVTLEIAVVAGLVILALVLLRGRSGEARRLQRKVRAGGMSRSYILHLPAKLGKRDDWRLLIAFHPALATGNYMEQQTALHSVEGSEGFIVAYPDGFARTWNAGTCCGPAMRQGIDDLAFFDAIIADVRSLARIRDKVYVTGFSNGALMAYYLMCQRSDRLAAASTFGAYLPPKTLAEHPGGQVPLLHIHGDADPEAPVEGGMTHYLGALPPAIDTVEAVALRNGCDMSRVRHVPMPELDSVAVQYAGDDPRAEASLCVVPGLGHVWPGSTIQITKYGAARPELEGSKVMLEFFRNH